MIQTIILDRGLYIHCGIGKAGSRSHHGLTLDIIAPPPCSSRPAAANEAATQLPELPLVQVTLPPLPALCAEMLRRGWDAVDVVFVTGDAYVDHPAFAMGILGRVLEAAGFRVAILSQPDWRTAEPWRQFGRPRLFFGISAGNMDSMINHYTANKKVRNDDAYSPGGRIGLRPDRATLPYCERAREAFPGTPVIAGGVEASLRRLAHYDYWSDTVKRSILLDAKADLVVFGMGEQAIVEIARRLAAGHDVRDLRDLRGVAYALGAKEEPPADALVLPSFEEVKTDKRKFALATRTIHQETNPLNARRLVQYHDRQAVVCNPPMLPISQDDMDRIYGLPYTRKPHPMYRGEPIPAFETVKDSVTIMRGCFGGCTFCSITAHQGRIIQSALPAVGPRRAPPDGRRAWLLGRGLRHRRPHRQHVPDALHQARGRGHLQAALVRPPQDLQAARHRPRPARRPDAREPRGPRRTQGAGRLGSPHGPGPCARPNTWPSWPATTSADT